MIGSIVRKSAIAAIAGISLLVGSSQARACVVFSKADPNYWSEHATSIVDATVYAAVRKPLSKSGDPGTASEYPDTWVLKLLVHTTLRGEKREFEDVATRFFNTTIVDESYVLDLVGARREFAILDVPYSELSPFKENMSEPSGLQNRGIHVRDESGQELDEIWEGICTALPIFELGTFRR